MCALKPSEDTYRILYEDNPSMYFAVDSDGMVLSVNRFGSEKLGYPVDQLVGQPVKGVFHPEDQDAVDKQLKSCFDNPGTVFQWQLRKVRSDGSIMWVQELARVVEDPDGNSIILIVCEDITARRQAERDLHESRERYKTLYTASPAMLHSIDREYRLLDVSKYWLEVLGYEREEVVGRSITDFMTEESGRKARGGVIDEFIKRGSARDIEYQYIKKNGETVDILLSAIAEYDDEGEFARSLAILVDVTEKKRAEEALQLAHDEMEQRVIDRTTQLQESRERFRQLVETVRVIPWESTKAANNLSYIGPQAVDILGYPREKWYEQGFWMTIVHPDDQENAKDFYQNAARRGIGDAIEYRIEAADGRILWIHEIVNVVGADDPDSTVLRGFMIDITKSKQAEEMLEQQRAFLHQVIDINPNFIFAKDREGRFTLINQAVADAYGTSVEDLIGKTDADFNPNTQEVEFFRKMDLEVMDTLEEKFIPEETVTTSTGETRWMQSVKRPIIGEDGTADLVLGSATDITARKRAEAKLQESESALRISQHRLQELAGKLLSAQEEERRRLAREIHDDLTQRLAGLGSKTGYLVQEIDKDASEEITQVLKEVHEELVRLSGDVHALSRELHPSMLEHLGLEEALSWECESFSGRSGVKTAFSSAAVPEHISKDLGICLYRIAQEALNNVARHADTDQASVSLKKIEGSLELVVQDQGAGFERDKRAQVQGIGLDSMEERARLVHGVLSIESSPAKGTTVRVRVPVSDAAVSPVEVATSTIDPT